MIMIIISFLCSPRISRIDDRIVIIKTKCIVSSFMKRRYQLQTNFKSFNLTNHQCSTFYRRLIRFGAVVLYSARRPPQPVEWTGTRKHVRMHARPNKHADDITALSPNNQTRTRATQVLMYTRTMARCCYLAWKPKRRTDWWAEIRYRTNRKHKL